MLLFTRQWELFDWFGWGDWLYVLASVISVAQCFALFIAMDDDTYAVVYIFGKSLLLIILCC
jgi:hypothetical protein